MRTILLCLLLVCVVPTSVFAIDLYACNDKLPGQGLGCSIGTLKRVAFYSGKDGMFINLEAEHSRTSTSDSDAKWYNPMSWNDTVISVTYTNYPGCKIRFNFDQYADGIAMLKVLNEKKYKKITCRSDTQKQYGRDIVSVVQWNENGSITLEY